MAQPETYSKKNPRIPLFYWCFAFAFAVLISALVYRQIFLYDYYIERGERQSMRRVIEPGTRGDIYDRNGKLLVTNEPIFSAVVYFNDVRKEFREEYFKLKKIELQRLSAAGIKDKPNYRELARKARSNVLNRYLEQINNILGSDYRLGMADYDKHFTQKQLLPFPLIRNLSAREHAILAERIPVDSPIQIYTDTARYYPYGDVASHALGYVANNFDDDISQMPGGDLRTYAIVPTIGRSGIESAFDGVLAGRSGAKIWIVDLAGYKYENVLDFAPTKGDDVFSSLDIDIRRRPRTQSARRKGAAVMLDVNSGEILALVSRPSYDPNSLTPYITNKVNAEITERGAWLNRATQGLYPPGSTFKIITAMAGFSASAIDEHTVKTCTGGYRVGSRIFPCNNRYGHGNLDLVGAIAHSCNVYFYETGIEAGIDKIADIASEFGFGESSGIELNEDSWRRTIIATPEYKKKNRKYDGPWTDGDTANSSIGQGYMRFTPLQMATFTASFCPRRNAHKSFNRPRQKSQAFLRIPRREKNSPYKKPVRHYCRRHGCGGRTRDGKTRKNRRRECCGEVGNGSSFGQRQTVDAGVDDSVRAGGVSRSGNQRDSGRRRAGRRRRRSNCGADSSGGLQKIFFGNKQNSLAGRKLISCECAFFCAYQFARAFARVLQPHRAAKDCGGGDFRFHFPVISLIPDLLRAFSLIFTKFYELNY